MRRWPWVVAALGSVALAAIVGAAWLLRGPEQAAVWAGILALLLVGFALFGWARAAARAPLASSPVQADAAARMLALEVGRQWREEAGRRGLTDPEPLAVRWRSVTGPLADHARLTGRVSGRSDDVPSLVERFLALPHRRLVVLGPPGAGKTSLMVLMVLELWRRYELGGEVVPVLLSANSWDPRREHLRAWIERQLNVLYPALRAADYGPTAAGSLLSAGRVLPMVDGLDELPEVSRAEALRRLNEALREGGPLVLTCRVDDFGLALQDTDVVTGAAVIEAQAIGIDDAEGFLLEAVPPASPTTASWRAMFARARAAPGGPLAAALSSPLQVWLMRAVYADAGRDPGILAELADATAIEDLLLDAVVPVVFDSSRQRGSAGTAWDTAAAERWLRFVAGHLDRLNTSDLAWWRLREEAPAIVRLVIFGLLGGLLAEVLIRLPGLGADSGIQLVVPMLALVFGVLGASQDPEQRPRRRALHPLLVWPISGLGVGLALGALRSDLPLGLAAGLAVGLASWLAGRVVPAFKPTKWQHSLVFGAVVAAGLGSLAWFGVRLAYPAYTVFVALVVWLVGALAISYLAPEWSSVPLRRGLSFGWSIVAWTVTSIVVWRIVSAWASVDPFFGGLAYGALAGMLSPDRPGRVTRSLRAGRQATLQALSVPAICLMVGAVAAAVLLPVGGPGGATLASSLVLALLLPVLVALMLTKLIQVPAGGDRATSPRLTLSDERTLALVAAPVVAVVIGPASTALVLVAVLELSAILSGIAGSGLVAELELALSVCLVGGVAALAYGFGRPWLSYIVARTWLALRGRLPWRLMSFLDDAHRLGLLRQVGPFYQFRHAGLQDRLARARPAEAAVTPHPGPPPQRGREINPAASS